MKNNKFKIWILKNPNKYPSKLITFAYRIVTHFSLLVATLTGYIPLHTLRNIIYRYILRVHFPSDSIIYWRCRFFKPSGVNIGHHSIIGNDAFLDGRSGLFIGNNVNIAGEVRIYTVEHDIKDTNFVAIGESVYIKDWVYIGARVTILPGVTIGEGAVVASGAVVTKNVESWTMVGGVPAKYVSNRPILHYTLDTKNKVLFQ